MTYFSFNSELPTETVTTQTKTEISVCLEANLLKFSASHVLRNVLFLCVFSQLGLDHVCKSKSQMTEPE